MLTPEILARARYLHERIRELSKSAVEPVASRASTDSASSGLAGSRHSEAATEASERSTGPKRVGGRSPESEADFLFWKKQLSGSGYDRFAERLASLGISEEDALFLSQTSSFPDEQPVQAGAGLDRDEGWDEIFKRALEQPALHLEGADVFPFAKLWLPLVSLA